MTRNVTVVTALAATFSCLLSLPAAFAGEFRSYEFLPDQPRLFTYAGGLLGTDVKAQLAGSFDVDIASDGTTQVTRFDVQLNDILDTGLFEIGWMDGDSLRDELFLDPVGLIGQRADSVINIGPMPVEPDGFDEPLTNIYIKELGGGMASVRISSRPAMVIDSASMSTEPAGFLVRVVPEPTLLILAAGIVFLPSWRTRKTLPVAQATRG
jgi:hypothetical protein